MILQVSILITKPRLNLKMTDVFSAFAFKHFDVVGLAAGRASCL